MTKDNPKSDKLAEAKKLIEEWQDKAELFDLNCRPDREHFIQRLLAAQNLISREEQRKEDAEIFRISSEGVVFNRTCHCGLCRKHCEEIYQKILNPTPDAK